MKKNNKPSIDPYESNDSTIVECLVYNVDMGFLLFGIAVVCLIGLIELVWRYLER